MTGSKFRAVNGRKEKGELVFSHSGRAGEIVKVSRTPCYLLRVEAMEMADLIGGAGARVLAVVAQNRLVWRDGFRYPRPTFTDWSDAFIESPLTFKVFDQTLQPHLGVYFEVEFLADCEWQCRLLGEKFTCDGWEWVLENE